MVYDIFTAARTYACMLNCEYQNESIIIRNIRPVHILSYDGIRTIKIGEAVEPGSEAYLLVTALIGKTLIRIITDGERFIAVGLYGPNQAKCIELFHLSWIPTNIRIFE